MCYWIYRKYSSIHLWNFQSLKKLKNQKTWHLSKFLNVQQHNGFHKALQHKELSCGLVHWLMLLTQYILKNMMQWWKLYEICFWDQTLFIFCYCWPMFWCMSTSFYAFFKSVPLFTQQYLKNWLNLPIFWKIAKRKRDLLQTTWEKVLGDCNGKVRTFTADPSIWTQSRC